MNNAGQSSEFSRIITGVLADNTAQSVLNYLKALESNRAHVRTRWIWELLQNARDASINSDKLLSVSIEQHENEVIFRHNGSHFSLTEIAHLIYHGSTKVESEETFGQFGSGFLTTHLLSPEINVSGRIEDGRHFDFRLKREVGSVGALSASMQKAAKDFESSLCDMPTTDDFSTEFRYPLSSDACEVVDDGVEALKKCAPFVVAFNREFSNVLIHTPYGYTEFRAVECSEIRQAQIKLELVVVSVIEPENQEIQRYLLAHGNAASIAIPVELASDGYRCLPIDDVPRLFLGLPLIGTENFSIPAVVNSFKFTPTENRDGVHIGQSDNKVNLDNEAAIEDASELLVSLTGYVASSNSKDVYLLTEIPPIQKRDWLNTDWLYKHFRENVIPEMRRVPVVLAENGMIATEGDGAVIPFTKQEAGNEGVE